MITVPEEHFQRVPKPQQMVGNVSCRSSKAILVVWFPLATCTSEMKQRRNKELMIVERSIVSPTRMGGLENINLLSVFVTIGRTCC